MAKAKTKRKKTALRGQKRGNGVGQSTVRGRAPAKPFTGRDDPRNGPGDLFKPGFDPRRVGSGNHNPAWSVLRWGQELCSILPDGGMKYPRSVLEEIVKDADDSEEHPKVMAAGALLRARRGAADGDYSKAGIPLAANDLDRIFDRFIGKPVQSIITAQARRPTGDIIAELRALFQAFPELHAELAPGAVPALPPVDGEAIVRDGPENGDEHPVHQGIDQSPCSGESG